MADYGIPYMGSKQMIIKSLAMNFPKADHFYDLFGGGFSVTHYMALNRRSYYKYFHYNEIVPSTVELVKKAVAGDFCYSKFKPEFIGRDEFETRKKNDAYVRLCWSFGNDQRNYMFGTQIEPYKRSMHNAVVFDRFDALAKQTLGFDKWPSAVKSVYQKRMYLGQKIEWHRKKNNLPKCLHPFLPSKQLEQLQQLKQLRQLQQLQRLEQLQQLKQLQRLPIISLYSKDYRQVDIKKNSVVYCDIPYKDTCSYLSKFNHIEFYDWAMTRDFPVYVSEYNIADTRFNLVYQVDKLSLFNNSQDTKKTKSEKLYWNGVSL